MATIRTAIELQDNFTSVLYQVINSVNLGLSAMEDLHQSMNAQVDTSSIEAARDSINQATIAVQELDAAMQGVEAPTIPTPTAPVSTAPVNIPTPQPTQWQSYDGLEVFKNTGVERFEQEVASVNSMLQDLNAAQNRITQTAAESEVLSPQARYDVEAVENRVQALQQSIEQVEQNPLNIGSDSANASLEQLRARLSQTLELQDNLNAAMQGADISQINAAYLQLSQNISETERMVRDSFENIPPVEIPVTWKTDSLEVFTSTGVDRFQQEVQSANNMLNTLNTTQERIASTAAQTNLFPASAVADMGRMGSRLQAIQQRIQQIENNPLNIGTETANAELERLRGQLDQAVQEQENLDRAVADMDVQAANEAYFLEMEAYLDKGDPETAAKEIAEVFVEAVKSRYEVKGKIKGTVQADLNFFMIYYVFPAILKRNHEYAKLLADTLCETWGSSFKNSKIGYTDYETLYKAFREKIFGIF